jgi:hypothetical protein
VGLIAHGEIPLGGRTEQGLQVIAAAQHVDPGDQQGPLAERVAGARRLDLIARQDVEREAELERQLILPLLDKAARCDD